MSYYPPGMRSEDLDENKGQLCEICWDVVDEVLQEVDTPNGWKYSCSACIDKAEVEGDVEE
jgi:hypothetical protein